MTDHRVKLESLELKMAGENSRALGSVKVNLQNGQSSPVFEQEANEHFAGAETITFDPNVSIRAVDSISSWSTIASLQFYDDND